MREKAELENRDNLCCVSGGCLAEGAGIRRSATVVIVVLLEIFDSKKIPYAVCALVFFDGERFVVQCVVKRFNWW